MTIIRRQLVANLFSMTGVQIANYLLPLVTVPYLVRVVGPDKYGIVSFAQAFCIYFLILVDYGFELTATREVSRARTDDAELRRIFWNVIASKMLLFFASSVIFGCLLVVIKDIRAESVVFLLSFAMMLGNVFFPSWFLQGLERLTGLALFNLVIKTIFTVAVFVLVGSEEDYVYIPLSLSAGHILVGFAAFAYVVRAYRLTFYLPGRAELFATMKAGWKVFNARVVINLYTTTNTVILGFLATDASVGLYAAAMKIIGAVQGVLLVPLSSTSYPHLAARFQESLDAGLRSLRKAAVGFASVSFLASAGLALLAEPIVSILLGSQYADAVVILRIMAPLPFVIALSNVYGIQGMLNMGRERAFLTVTAIGAALSLVLNMLMVPPFAEVGTALSWLVTELFITTAFIAVLAREGVYVLSWSTVKSSLGLKP